MKKVAYTVLGFGLFVILFALNYFLWLSLVEHEVISGGLHSGAVILVMFLVTIPVPALAILMGSYTFGKLVIERLLKK